MALSDSTAPIQSGNRERQIKYTHEIINRVWDFYDSLPFQNMRSRQDLVDNSYCLAQPGHRYLVYIDERDHVNIETVEFLINITKLTKKTNRFTKRTTMADDEKIYMLNALWFKPEGGAAKYQEYLKAAGPHVAKYGGKATSFYHPDELLIGEFDADLVFFVEWPNQKAFDDFRVDPDFRKVSPLREAAIRDSLLIRCSKV